MHLMNIKCIEEKIGAHVFFYVCPFDRIELGQTAFAISAIEKRQRANDRIGMGQHLLDRLIKSL